MATQVHDDPVLVDAAMNLRAVAPVAWQQFLVAIEQYATKAAANMVSARLDMLPIAQGQAQALRSLSNTLTNAPELKDAALKRKAAA